MRLLNNILESLMEIRIKGSRSKTKKEKKPEPVRKPGQMAKFDPMRTKTKDIAQSAGLIQRKYPGVVVFELYLINTEGTSNKFHYFAIVQHKDKSYTAVNAYGRIGYPPRLPKPIAAGVRIDPVQNALNRKVQTKLGKGYRAI
jgi:hypothetical protein